MSKNRAFINFLFRISGVNSGAAFHRAGAANRQKPTPGKLFSNIFLGAVSTPIKNCRLVRRLGTLDFSHVRAGDHLYDRSMEYRY